MQPANLWLSRYSKLVVAATFVLVYIGAMVTSKGVGLSVPDWPTSFGYNMFTLPFSRWVDGVEWEHGHRLVASSIGFLTLLLSIWIWKVDSRGWVRRLGVAASVLVIAQGVMGGLRVTEISTAFAILHGCTAQAFLCVLVLLALALSPSWDRPFSGQTALASGKARSLRLWAWHLTGAVYIQLILGALMRHLHAGLAIPTFPLNPEGTLMPRVHGMLVDLHFTHRFWALVVTVLTVVVAAKALRAARGELRLIWPSVALIALILAQIGLGASIIWSFRAPIPTSLHVLNGAAVLIISLVLSVRVTRFFSPQDAGTYPVPSAPLPA